MSAGGVAGLIAAIAFAVLVIFLIGVLVNVEKTMSVVQKSVIEDKNTVEVVTKDVDILSREVEGLLTKGNELFEDVNQKVATIDPLFTAVADLSTSVSELNASGKDLASRLTSLGKTTAQATVAGKVGQAAMKFFKKNQTTEQ